MSLEEKSALARSFVADTKHMQRSECPGLAQPLNPIDVFEEFFGDIRRNENNRNSATRDVSKSLAAQETGCYCPFWDTGNSNTFLRNLQCLSLFVDIISFLFFFSTDVELHN